jgi:uncharacterized membrane protein YdjX (TVP38/TMEM64 family)
VFFWYIEQHDLAPWSRPIGTVQHLEGLLLAPSGPLLLLAGFALSSLIFLPSSIFLIVSGFVYGPISGLFYAFVGFNIAGLVAYALGYWFGYEAIRGQRAQRIIERYTERLRRHEFETIVLLRILTIPLDADAYMLGALHIPLRKFIPAAALGSIPSVLAYGLAGASITLDEVTGGIGINWWMLALSALFFVGTLVISRLLRYQREQDARRNEEHRQRVGPPADETADG